MLIQNSKHDHPNRSSVDFYSLFKKKLLLGWVVSLKKMTHFLILIFYYLFTFNLLEVSTELQINILTINL